jgi:hypothetical protein
VAFDPVDPIGSVFRELIGQRAWQVRECYGRTLTMEFGAPHLRVREVIPDAKTKPLRRPMVTVRGDWHLWIYMSNWQIVEAGDLLADSEGHEEQISKGLRAIDGQKLVDVEVGPDHGRSSFTFELGTSLQLTSEAPVDAERHLESWLLYAPDGNVLSYAVNGRYSWQAGTTVPDDEVWLPLPTLP